jgi:hypothetical protein
MTEKMISKLRQVSTGRSLQHSRHTLDSAALLAALLEQAYSELGGGSVADDEQRTMK